MKVLFMGTPDFARGVLQSLIESKHEVVLAVTQPDKSRGRGVGVTYSEVKELALEHDIPVFQPDRIRKPENVEYLKNYQFDVIVVVAFGQLLPKEILDMPKYGCVNVHASLLPKYRGAAPIQWAVLNGDEVTGVTTMRMDEGLDTGDIIMQRELRIDPRETSGTLFDRLMNVGAELLIDTLESLNNGTATFTKQNEDLSTKTTLISKAMGIIDFSKSAKEVDAHVRGMSPWPSAFCYFNGKMMKLLDVEVAENTLGDGEPGTIVTVDKKNFYIQTGNGVIKVNELQLEGKKKALCEEFLRGYHIEAGMKLSTRR